MYTAGKIKTWPDWKFTCPVGHVSIKVYEPWNKIYMPQACGHTLMLSPALAGRKPRISPDLQDGRQNLELALWLSMY